MQKWHQPVCKVVTRKTTKTFLLKKSLNIISQATDQVREIPRVTGEGKTEGEKTRTGEEERSGEGEEERESSKERTPYRWKDPTTKGEGKTMVNLIRLFCC